MHGELRCYCYSFTVVRGSVVSVSTSWSSDRAGINALAASTHYVCCFGAPQIPVVEPVSPILSAFELYCAVRQSSS